MPWHCRDEVGDVPTRPWPLTKQAEIPGVKNSEIFHDRDAAELLSPHVKVQKEPSMKSVTVSLQPSLPAVL